MDEERKMRSRYVAWIAAAALAFLLAGGATKLSAQYGQEKPSLDKSKQQPATPAPATPPVNVEEDAAFKAYQDAPPADFAKKAQLGEEFLQKFPQSRYVPAMYSSLTLVYYSLGQVQKMTEMGAKSIAATPNDVQVLAILGQTIPRALSKDSAVAIKQLEQAEQYAKKAIEVAPTLPKPASLTDESFAAAKNTVLAMAHGGLGLVYIHRQKFGEAVTELDQAVKMDTQPDPVNYYLLGLANEKTSHFDDAASAFTKCAGIPGQMQAVCKAGVEEAKKLAATQLSAPK
jgi:tetratricopeptide (TPR) repeat protein